MTDTILTRAASLLRPVPDWPQPGITFWDLSPVLGDVEAMRTIASDIAEYWRPLNVDIVSGFDSRGFLFGPMVAERLGVSFTMIRKCGKLPPPTKSISYTLEYGEAEIEMATGAVDGKRVLLIDDLLATGGTAAAGVELVTLLGGNPVGFACVTELPELGGRAKLLSIPVQSLITVMGNQACTEVEYCVDVFAHCPVTGRVILVERQGAVPGIAMPGGRIESHESVLTAAMRELYEETGQKANTIRYCCMLTGMGRDPRGAKVSVVLKAAVPIEHLRGESGKTRPFVVESHTELPNVGEFVLGHGACVHKLLATNQDAHAK